MKSASPNNLLNLIGTAHMLDEAWVSVDASVCYDARATLDDTHNCTTPDGSLH